MKVTLKNVTKKYGSNEAIKNFSAELPDGHLICLLGPSGCGKSTLLNMICGITDVTDGQIFFDDKDVTKISPDKRNIGMVFQNYALYPHMTVLENICFPLEIKKISKSERIVKAEEAARLVHVDTLLKRYPSELSGGQQQRVAIARALVKSPSLLLMDEPLSNLDARLRLEMREEIRRIQSETGVTTVFVTHDQEEAMSISDSIILMKDGNFVQSGLCQELYVEPENLFVAEFLGNPPVNKIDVSAQINSCLQITPSGTDVTLSFAECTAEDVAQKEFVLAVRPESFVLEKDLSSKDSEKYYVKQNKPFSCRVERISEMGKDRIVYVNIAGTEVRTILPDDEEISEGKIMNLYLRKKGTFLFEKASGKRLV